jgi:hypothetical protein
LRVVAYRDLLKAGAYSSAKPALIEVGCCVGDPEANYEDKPDGEQAMIDLGIRQRDEECHRDTQESNAKLLQIEACLADMKCRRMHLLCRYEVYFVSA